MKVLNYERCFAFSLLAINARHDERNNDYAREKGEPDCTHSIDRSAQSAQCRLLVMLVGRLGLVDAEGDLVGDADAVAFEGDDLFGVVGEDANVLEAEVD